MELDPIREEITFPSKDGAHTLYGVLYRPRKKPRGIFQMIHGMTDYSLRYEALLRSMAEAGFLAFSYDQLGHGKSAGGELGFIASRLGWRLLAEDCAETLRLIKERFGEYPTVSAGHSLGSFVLRTAVGEGLLSPSGLVLVGTDGKNAFCDAGIALSRLLSLVKGEKHVSDLLYRLVFRNYDKGFPGDWHNRWVSVDVENLKKYAHDPYCTFRFSTSAMEDLIRLHKRANAASFFQKVECPVLLLSGKDDPVGQYGKGVEEVKSRLERAGKSVQCHLFEGFRHEILQDFCSREAQERILLFSETVATKKKAVI